MDFLDPKRKKSHRKRLFIGYLLMAIVVAMGTLILLFSAFGFWVDRKTGDVIQNGTVFVDSQPGNSSVYLNGKLQSSKTASRLVLPGSQQYTIKLTQDGYRDWSRVFTLEGGSIARLVYPLMVPKTLTTIENQLYASVPAIMSQSIDKRWLLVQQSGATYVFDLYDLNSPKSVPVTLTIPSSILTDPTKPATLSVVNWSADNRHVLIRRDFNGTSEYLMLDTNNANSTVNINTVLAISSASVSLRDKKSDQVYLYDSNGGVLRQGDLKNKSVSSPILNNVLTFQTNGSDLVLYATSTGADTGKVDIRVRENDKATYLLKSVPEATKYHIDINEFDGTPYYVVGTNTGNAIFVYKDPLPTLKGQRDKALLIPAVLRQTNPQFVSFAPSDKFIAVQSKNDLIVYDIQDDRQYKVTLEHEIAATDKLSWMDGFRFALVDKGQGYVVDYDGSNDQLLVPSVAGGMFFAPDNRNIITMAPSKTVTGRFSLTQTSLTKK